MKCPHCHVEQDIASNCSRYPHLCTLMQLENLKEIVRNLYLAGKWSCPTIPEPEQIKLWEQLRDEAGIPPGTATQAGVGNSPQPCNYDKAWIGKCTKPVTQNGRCQDHQNRICSSCGKPATRECPETGQFVCGAPLCDNCEHVTFPDGTNGGIGFNAQTLPKDLKTHVMKGEQKYKPWFERPHGMNADENVPEQP